MAQKPFATELIGTHISVSSFCEFFLKGSSVLGVLKGWHWSFMACHPAISITILSVRIGECAVLDPEKPVLVASGAWFHFR
jgi:hypothetical protein